MCAPLAVSESPITSSEAVLPEAAERPEEWARGIARDHGEAAAGAVRLSELRALAHRADD